jgi:hypothetical protein
MSPTRYATRKRRGGIFIPTVSDVKARITIVDDDSVTHTLMDTNTGDEADNHIISASITRTVTDTLGSFKFRIANDGGRFLRTFDGGETVNVYADRTDATTLIFRGKVDNVNYGMDLRDGFFIELDGRGFPELIDRTITGTESAATADIGLAGIFDEFFSDITLAFWNGSAWAEATYDADEDTVDWSPAAPTFPSTLINMTYQNKKGWSVVTEICKRAGLDCYMEYDGSKWTLRTFVQNSITNPQANVAYGVNLRGLNEFGVDNAEIVNRVIVYGKTVSDNILLLKTENDTSSQSELWIKDRIFKASDLETMDEVQDKADFELSQGIDATDSGRFDTLMIPELRPGDLMNASVPYCNVDGTYKVQRLTHNLGKPFTTNVEVSKKIRGVKDIFIPKVNVDEFIGALANPNNMTDSYTVYFSESPTQMLSLENVEEVDGKLRLQSGETTGIAISKTYTADNNATECELRRYENFETNNDKYYVSNDGGDTWERYGIGEGNVHTFTTTGQTLAFKIEMARTAAGDTSPSYEAICLLYK